MARKKKRPNKNLQPGETPERLKWRPRFRIIGFLSGLIGGLGAVVLVAQYGVAPLSRALSVQGLFGAMFSGLILPSVVFAIVVQIHNKRLDRSLARARAGGASPTLNTVLLLLLASVFVAPFVDTRVASAEVSGPCGGEINGIDLADVEANANDAFEILEGQTVRGSLFVDGTVVGGRAGLSMFGFEIAGELETSDDPGGREEFEFDYDEISWLGSGLIELWVDAELSNGQSCEIRFMINIDGDPLETVVGQAAAGAVGVGAAGMTLSGAGAVLEGGRTMGDLRRALAQVASSEGIGLDVDGAGGGDVSGGGADIQSLNYEVGDASNSVTVSQGDSLWSLSENELQNRLGRPPTDAETAEFWQQVIDTNVDSLQSGDPDLIMPGETIEFPGGEVPSGGSAEVPTSTGGGAGEAVSAGEAAAADVAPVDAHAEPAGQAVATDVAGVSESAGDTSWWSADTADAGESRTVVAEGVQAAADGSFVDLAFDPAGVAGIAGLTAAALLVPARYLLLEKINGGGDPDTIDPRLTAERERQISALPVSDRTKESLNVGLDEAANDRYNSLLNMLTNDFAVPTSIPDISSWPPRVGAAIAWMHLADNAPLSQIDLADVCGRSTYIDNLLDGRGRTITLIEQKAEWPWT